MLVKNDIKNKLEFILVMFLKYIIKKKKDNIIFKSRFKSKVTIKYLRDFAFYLIYYINNFIGVKRILSTICSTAVSLNPNL